MKPTFGTIPIESIDVRPQLRTQSWGDIAELARMIEVNGFVVPIVVYKRTTREGETRFVLVAGERRLRAVKRLGWEEIPAQIIPQSLARDTQLQENAGRVELHWLELAEGFAAWEAEGYPQAEIARVMGTHPSWVSRLLKARAGLLPETRELLAKERAKPPLDLALRWASVRGFENQKKEVQRWLGTRERARRPIPEGEKRATIQTLTVRKLLRQALSRGASATVLRTLEFLLGKGRNPWAREPGKTRPRRGRPQAS